MNLFIRLKNGMPFEHPIAEDNFRQAFPDVDVNNLPSWAAHFERIPQPQLGAYEVYEGVTYGWVEGVVKDVHKIRSMTAEEKAAKQEQVKSYWAQTGFASWIFDEDTCSFKAPVPYPTDGKFYKWDELTTSWKLAE